jgi:hypothetical protein
MHRQNRNVQSRIKRTKLIHQFDGLSGSEVSPRMRLTRSDELL